jgi:hypothetical protein
VLQRDRHACQWRTGAAICGQAANQCDHINPDGPDELWNLQALCPMHHKFKSGTEAGMAWGKIRRQMAAARYRPQPRHPGLL